MYRISEQYWETTPTGGLVRGRRGTRRRLHRDRGPARTEKWFRNEGDPTPYRTKRSWWWHGVRIPKYYGEGGKITIQGILKQTNSEVFRILVEAYGLEKFTRKLSTTGLKRYQDDYGVIWQLYKPLTREDQNRMWEGNRRDRERAQGAWRQRNLLELVNSTPEPDGSFKHYFEWIPTELTSPKEAIARQFGIREADQYAPEIET